MSTIVTRAGKGSPLTHAEVDSNFTNLNSDKVEASAGTLTNPSIAGVASFADGSAAAPAITNTGDTNTGIFFPAADTIAFSEGGTEAMRLDSSGNLGLGVTPSAWYTGLGLKSLQIGSYALVNQTNGYSWLSRNAYTNSSNVQTYIESNYATRYQQGDGVHSWYTAPSGTAGNAITFTQAMTLDASGRLGIGTTSPATPAHIQNASGNTYYRSQNNLAVVDVGVDSAGTAIFYNNNNYPMTFGTNGSERMRIDSSGNLLVGTTGTNTNDLGVRISGQKVQATSNSTNCFFANRANSTGSLFDFQFNAGAVGSISTNGSSTAYNTSSDYRLKENQAPLTGSGAFIDALQPKTWTWITDGSVGTGFIAHEVQEVSPNSVVGEKDAVDEEGNPIMQAMEYGSAEFIANIIAELQDLRKRVSALENK